MNRLPVIFLSLLIITIGCTSRSDRRIMHELDRIDAMMETHPDSALEALRTMRIDSNLSPSLRARHALLHSRALDKNFIDLTSDSIIAPAVDYYISRNDRKYLGRALFYHGRIFENQGNPERALRSYLEAERYLIDTEDHLMLGKNYQKIGIIFYELFFEKESLDFLKRSLKEFEIYGDSTYIGYTCYLLGNAARLADLNEDALRYSGTAMDVALRTDNEILLSYSIPNYATSLYETGDFKTAYDVMKLMDSVSMISLSDVDKNSFINICNHEGDTVLSDFLLKSIQSPAMGPLDYLVERGRYMEAYETAMSLVDSMNNIICDISRQGLTSTMNEVSRNETLHAVNEKNNIRRNAIVILSCIVMILLLVVILYRKATLLARERQNNLKIQEEKYELIVRNLTHELKESEFSRLYEEKLSEEKVNAKISFLRSSYGRLDKLCKSFMEAEAKKSATKSVYTDVKNMIDSFRLGGKSIAPLEEDINALTGDAIRRLRSEKTSFTEDDYHLMLLSVAGFSSFSISMIMGVNPHIVYNRKFRLKERLGRIGSDAAYEILKFIK